MTTIARHRCAVIAEVDGLASAAGCQWLPLPTSPTVHRAPHSALRSFDRPLLLHADGGPVAQRLEQTRHGDALTGDVITAEHAARIGLVNAVVPQNELSAHVGALASRIAAKSQAAITYGKRAFLDQKHLPLEDAYALTAGIMTRNMLDGAACEGLDAFISKRQPNWPNP